MSYVPEYGVTCRSSKFSGLHVHTRSQTLNTSNREKTRSIRTRSIYRSREIKNVLILSASPSSLCSPSPVLSVNGMCILLSFLQHGKIWLTAQWHLEIEKNRYLQNNTKYTNRISYPDIDEKFAVIN
jgi:hypothetical protein